MVKYSVVIPVFNEEKNVTLLHTELKKVLQHLPGDSEIIFVNDCSSDGTLSRLIALQGEDGSVVIADLKRNSGQTMAFYTGFQLARGEIVITMDGDLQNDPKDIPKLLKQLGQGYDVVNGWRFNRRDKITIRIMSKVASLLRRILTGDTVHDPGCSLRVYRSEAVKDLFLYGEMHRYLITLIKMKGFRVVELKVNHRERRFGKSKYNLKKVFRGFVDLINYKFWLDYSQRPLQFFVKYGLILIFLGFLSLVYNLVKYGLNLQVGPTLMLSVLFFIGAIQFIGLGFLAEIQIKSYFQSHPGELVQVNRVYRKNDGHN